MHATVSDDRDSNTDVPPEELLLEENDIEEADPALLPLAKLRTLRLLDIRSNPISEVWNEKLCCVLQGRGSPPPAPRHRLRAMNRA